MNKRRERTLPDICDATPCLPQPQITPVLTGNFRMEGPNDESNCDYLIKTVKSENNDLTRYCDRSPTVDYRGKSGKCNVCSAPCSSCFHVDKVLMNDDSAGETCAENIETGLLSELSSVAGMNSTFDPFSESALGKRSLNTSNAAVSDDSIVRSKSDGKGVQEGNDDCLSGVSGTDENAIKKCDPDDSRIKHDQSTCGGESPDKAPLNSSRIGLHSNSRLVEIPSSRITNSTTEVQNVHSTFSETSNRHDQNERGVEDDKPCGIRDKLLQKSDEHVDLLSPKALAKAFDADCGDPPGMALNSDGKNEDMDLYIHNVDETEDSEMVEQDVKVCDICGDAGREDLLATCSRCIDGAEHTYCMREMLVKLPEGEWLCEECKNLEQMETERRERVVRVVENERNNSSCHASSEHVNSSDIEGQRTNVRTGVPSKRLRDDADIEVSSRMKKPAIELFVESPKIFNSGEVVPALSPTSSSKSFDKGRDHSSLETILVNEATESTSSASESRLRNFSKSNSFNSVSSNPRVKLVDHVIIQRQKSMKGHGLGRVRDSVVRSMDKSKSFKMINSIRPEPKVKMLSPRHRQSEIQDMKTTKQRTPYERQLSSKTELVSITSSGSGAKIEKKTASIGESSSWTAAVNKQPVGADGKKAALSRSASLAVRRTADLSPLALGEFRRPTAHVNSTLAASCGDGANTEQKSHQARLKEDSSASISAERPPLNTSGGVTDGLARHSDLANSGERTREPSGSRFARPSAKFTKDEGPNIRAAIEAAVLRKPGPFLKNKILGQSDESTMLNTSCEVSSHQDRISGLAGGKKISSDSEQAERSKASRNSTVKQKTFNNLQQPSLIATEGVSCAGGNGACISNSSRDHLHNFPTAMPVLKLMAIPEHEHIWQGSFEICRSGKAVESWDGIQAHLSTTASPKVIEAVNKFKSRIILNEVSRLSTWPVQFQEHGVREDNIALFFFAKDLDCYNKIYKVLLDNMMKKDLALKGITNGVELLIFSSNQLPENSRKWNMLFFLWGVFRAKKESCQQQIPESSIQFSTSQDNPRPILSVPENRCSIRPIPESQDSPTKKENCQQRMPESSIQFSTSQGNTQPILSVPENRCSIRPMMPEGQDSPAKKEIYQQRMPESSNQFSASQDNPQPILSVPANRCSIRPMVPESQRASAKKEDFQQRMPESSIQFSTSQDNTQPILLVSENRCLIRPMMPECHDSPTKKEICQQRMPESSSQFSTSQDNRQPISTVPESRYSITPMVVDLPGSRDSPPVLEMPSLGQFQSYTLLRAADGDRCVKVSSFDQLDHKMNSICGAGVQINNAMQNQELATTSQEGGISSHRSPVLALKRSLSGREQIQVQLDASLDTRQLPHFWSKSVGDTPRADIGVRNILDNSQNLVKFGMDAGEPSMNRLTPKEEERFTRDLNVEPDKWISDNESMSPGGNRLLDDQVESLVPNCNNNPERFFFPITSKQVKGITLADGSSSWKMHLMEPNRAVEKTPSLELALGAETKPSMQGIWPLLAGETKVNAEHNLDDRGIKPERDVSASLSLSLAFPFSQNEQSRKKPAVKAGKLITKTP